VIQFDFLEGKQAGSSCVARRFPFQVGRKSASDLVLQEDGIWDDHLRIRIHERDVLLEVMPGARAFVNDEPVQTAALASGDVITLGAVRMRFGLCPSTQRSLRLRESLTWVLLLSLFVAQIAVIGWLLRA